jgi:heat-inducible transcriptional repressor
MPAPNPPGNQLDPRSRQILRTLIAQYIRDGQPVGSRTLAQQAGLDISPATIRNVMADLEEIGLVQAPHASSGRIPTTQGYRMFVDSLLEVRTPNEHDIDRIHRELPATSSTHHLLNNASTLLSGITHFVGLVTVPRREQFAFRHIDFVPIEGNRVLVILVFTDHEVQNRVIETTRCIGVSELEQIANYLNAHFSGVPLAQIRQHLLIELNQAKAEMNQLMSLSIEVAEAALTLDTHESDFLVSGQTNLMGLQNLTSIDRLRALFDAFQHKQELLGLLDQCTHAHGVRLFIGEESGFSAMGDCSLVAAPYGTEGKTLGVLGVIGPTRMHYEKVISVVRTTSQMLSTALNRRTTPP